MINGFIRKYLLICFTSAVVLGACEQKKTEMVWEKSFYQIGSQSSPKTSDLNKDGVQDIVIGAGLAEMAETDQGVIALDGKTGEILWEHPATASMVGSASIYDINEDGIDDVIIGGRGANLFALDGKTGEEIWSYTFQFEDHPVLRYARYNFYNSSLIADQNGDGISDLLTINGGNWEVPANSLAGRQPGVLMLFDLKTGDIIAADTMPDGKESYMSPICFQQTDSEELSIIIGTGGETISGNLYLTNISDLHNNNLKNAKRIASEQMHGFIAPPTVSDITGDGYLDIISISHASTLSAWDGKTHKELWKHQFPHRETSNSLTMGYFTEDETLDVFAMMSKGVWPNYTKGYQVMVDGQTGEIAYEDSAMGCFTLSSALAYDLNGDGRDEVILSNNEYDCSLTVAVEDSVNIDITHALLYYDFKTKALKTIDRQQGFKNFYSSPWLGDLDEDSYLDIVYPIYFQPGQISRFMGMKMRRISTAVKMK